MSRERATVWYYEVGDTQSWFCDRMVRLKRLLLTDKMPSSNLIYLQAEAKGRLLFQRLHERLYNSATSDVVRGNLDINYDVERFSCPPDHGSEVVNAFETENIDCEGWWSVAVKSRGSPEKLYDKFFCPAQGSIFCPFNDKTNDLNDPENRLHWSEIVFQIYEMEAARALQPLRLLRTVWRWWIVNPDTVTILGEAKSFGNPIDEGLPYIEYHPGGDNDSGFFALLGCPNGSGVVRMLTDHCSALGHKTITSVRVLNSSNSLFPPTMYFVLADFDIAAPTTKSKRSLAGQRRQAKRHQKPTLARCRVLCLLEMLSGGQRACFVHAVSDRSFMSAVALLAKQVEVSVMDQLCKCCPRRQNPTLHLHVVSLGICLQVAE